MNERFDYFKNVEKRYKSTISIKKPVIIRFDGKGVSSNKSLNLLDKTKGEFTDTLKESAKYLSKKYWCISYLGSDELSLIFFDGFMFREIFGSVDTQKISSIFGEELFYYFNLKYKGECSPIYFDARCYSIPENKIVSYLKYREGSIKNTLVQYYGKKYIPYSERKNKKLSSLIDLLRDIEQFKNKTEIQDKGVAFYHGKEYDIDVLIDKLSGHTDKNDNEDII